MTNVRWIGKVKPHYIYNFYHKKIDAEEHQEHEKLPSKREWCEIFDVSRITVRRTLQELEREGYIYKLYEKGTFVAPKSYNQSLVKMYSFTEERKKLGKHTAIHVLPFEVIPVDERLVRKEYTVSVARGDKFDYTVELT